MVIILGLDINGLTVCRALGRFNTPLIGITNQNEAIGCYSKYFQKIYDVSFDDKQLVQFLLTENFASEGRKPLLFPTTDLLVGILAKSYSVLSTKFWIGFKDPDLIQSLLDKDSFRVLAEKNGLRVSKGVVLQRNQLPDIGVDLHDFQFPVILKTCKKYYPKSADDALPKAILYDDPEALNRGVGHFLSRADKVIVEEFVNGEDSDVYFVLVYSNKQGKVIKSFSGQKIRQWPIGTGGTASARPVNSPSLVEETTRFFDNIGFTGLGSMEYKFDQKRKVFIAIEPTVGRIDFQEGVAIGNGMNFPSFLYFEESGKSIPIHLDATTKKEWICFDADYNALNFYKRMSLSDNVKYLVSTMFKHNIYSVFDIRDIMPFIHWAKKRFFR